MYSLKMESAMTQNNNEKIFSPPPKDLFWSRTFFEKFGNVLPPP